MAADGLAAALRFDLGAYSDLDSREVLDEYLVPVASPAFMAQHPEIAAPTDLRASLLLHDAQPWMGAMPHEEWECWFRGAGVALPPEGWGEGHQFNMSLLATQAALGGQGIAMGRLALVLEDLQSGRLCTPFPHFVRSRGSYHLVTSAHAPAGMEHVRAWLVAQAEAFRKLRGRLLEELSRSGFAAGSTR
jgi:hypothetical protein